MASFKAVLFFIVNLLQILTWFFKTRLLSNAAKDLEILALRSQLALVQKDILAGKMPKPRFKPALRCFWVLLSKIFPAWQNTLVLVKRKRSSVGIRQLLNSFGGSNPAK